VKNIQGNTSLNFNPVAIFLKKINAVAMNMSSATQEQRRYHLSFTTLHDGA